MGTVPQLHSSVLSTNTVHWIPSCQSHATHLNRSDQIIPSMARNRDKRAPAQPVELSVLRWSHPQVSALILVAGFVFLVSLLKFSLISVTAHFALAALMLGVGCRVYVHLMGFLKKPCRDPLDLVRDIEVTLPSEKVDSFVGTTAENVNYLAPKIKSLILFENYIDTLKFMVLLYIITFVGAVFNTLTLLILSWVGTFLFPTIYDQNQEKFDEMAAQLVEKYQGIDAKINSFLPAPKQEAPAPVLEKEE